MELQQLNIFKFLSKLNAKGVGNCRHLEPLIEMYNAKTIDALIDLYNDILRDIVMSTKGYSEWVKGYWYDITTWDAEYKKYFHELDFLLNQHIKRIFDSTTDITEATALEFLVNIRIADGATAIFDYILTKCSEAIKERRIDLITRARFICEAPQKLRKIQKNRVEFLSTRKSYIDEMKSLLDDGYIKSIRDTKFEKDFYMFNHEKETTQKNVNIIDNIKASPVNLLLIIPVILISVGALYLFSKIGIIGLIIILGFPGFIFSFL